MGEAEDEDGVEEKATMRGRHWDGTSKNIVQTTRGKPAGGRVIAKRLSEVREGSLFICDHSALFFAGFLIVEVTNFASYLAIYIPPKYERFLTLAKLVVE